MCGAMVIVKVYGSQLLLAWTIGLGLDASPLTVPALPGTSMHRAPARPRLHGPAGHWIPAPGAAARACPGQLPPPVPAPPPG